jgi:Glycosyl hydrolase catalytic core
VAHVVQVSCVIGQHCSHLNSIDEFLSIKLQMTARHSKRGIAIPWDFSPSHFAIYLSAFESGKLSWLSNWEMWQPKGLPPCVPYVPQCRTGNEANQIHSYLSGYLSNAMVEDVLLGFNEPDMESQANLSPQDCAKLWTEHVITLRPKWTGKFGSPAVSNAPGPKGICWLQDFFAALGGVEVSLVDFVALHYYGTDVEHFKAYIREAHELFKKPIWLTEFACTNWNPACPVAEDQALAFMREALKFLDEQVYVERYAWFGAMEDVGEAVGRANGLQEGNQLSKAGIIYTQS